MPRNRAHNRKREHSLKPRPPRTNHRGHVPITEIARLVALQTGWTKAGSICGILSQPAWYCQLVIHGQWFMLPVYTLYTLAWVRGIRNNWRKREQFTMANTPYNRYEFERTRDRVAAHLAKARSYGGTK